MNWVAPIKDDTTLEKFKQKLREVDDKYYILFEIGVGTGLQLQEILNSATKTSGIKTALKQVSEQKISNVLFRFRRNSKRSSASIQKAKIRRLI
mgnify:CR=1 FL=1